MTPTHANVSVATKRRAGRAAAADARHSTAIPQYLRRRRPSLSNVLKTGSHENRRLAFMPTKTFRSMGWYRGSRANLQRLQSRGRVDIRAYARRRTSATPPSRSSRDQRRQRRASTGRIVTNLAAILDVVTFFEHYSSGWVYVSGSPGDYRLYMYKGDGLLQILALSQGSPSPSDDTLSLGGYYRRAPAAEVAALARRLDLPWPPKRK